MRLFMKKKITIILIICVVFGLLGLGYSLYRGLSRNHDAYEKICNSSKSWQCGQVDMVFYPKSTNEYNNLKKQYDLSDARFEMIGVLNFKNKKTVVCFTFGNAGTFSIGRADNKSSIITGYCDLAFLGFGNDIILKGLEYNKDFDLKQSKLTLVEKGNDSSTAKQNTSSYQVMKNGRFLGLPDESIGKVCEYTVDSDKKITVSIDKKIENRINLGNLMLCFSGLSVTKNINTENRIVNNKQAVDNIIYYYKDYVFCYNHYAENFGMSSVYGFDLKIYSFEKATLVNEIVYNHHSNFSSLEDKVSGKNYYSTDKNSGDITLSVEELKKDLDEEISSLFDFEEGDISLNGFNKKAVNICKISMGKTDYKTYYYQMIKTL